MVRGKTCYKVIMTPKEGTPETAYYDKETYLVTKQDIVLKSSMGEIPMEIFLDEYKETDGILRAHIWEQVMPMGKQVITIETVEHNVEMPADRFALPEEVKKLLEQEEMAKEKADPAKTEGG